MMRYIPGSVSLFVLMSYLTSTFSAVDEGEISVWAFIFVAEPDDNRLITLQNSMLQHVGLMAVLTLAIFFLPPMFAKFRKPKQ